MSNLWDYSGTASSNTTIEGLSTAEGMPVGNVDNTLRAIVALMFNSFTSSLKNFFLGTAALPVANGGTGVTSLAAAQTALGVLPEATAAQIWANTADKAISTDAAWSAAASVALTDGATVTPDFGAGINFTWTIGGNRTLATPTNLKANQSGKIEITQDGTGSRTCSFSSGWLFGGGADPTLSTTAGAKDILFYQVMSNATQVYATLIKGVA